MLVAQISDTHIATANAAAGQRVADLARTIDAINALTVRPDVVVHTGDVSHDASADDYAAARRELARLRCPVLATVGNRDRRDAFREAFAPDGYLDAASPFIQYAADVAGLRLVAVDTLDEHSALGGYCPDRAARLEQLLRGHGGPVLVFLHHPPVELPDLKGPALQFRDVREAGSLARVIAERSGIVAVISGHVHRSRSAAIGAVPLSTMGSIAADLNREALPAALKGRPVYHLHRIDGMGMSSVSVVV